MFIRPWNKEAERILIQLKKNGKAMCNNSSIARDFGKKHGKLLDRGFLDMASTRYSKRKDKTLFQTPEDVIVFQQGKNYHFKRFKIL